MNVLITGGSGFLGSNLSNFISKKGFKVKILDNFSRNMHKNINSEIELINCDVRDSESMIKYSKDTDIFIHLAFVNGTRYFYEKPELVLDVGIKGILNSIECINAHNIKKFILASSSEVYNEPNQIPTNEKEEIKIPDVLNPRFSYSSGKIISEILTINSANHKDIDKIIFRPHNIFGKNMGEEHVIPELIKKIYFASKYFTENSCTIEIQGSGSQTRAFCYIDDAIDQIFYLIENGKNNNVYNVGINNEIKILDLAKKIASILKIDINFKITEDKIGSASRRCPDINKIINLGYDLKNNFDNGLTYTVEWYKRYYLNKNV